MASFRQRKVGKTISQLFCDHAISTSFYSLQLNPYSRCPSIRFTAIPAGALLRSVPFSGGSLWSEIVSYVGFMCDLVDPTTPRFASLPRQRSGNIPLCFFLAFILKLHHPFISGIHPRWDFFLGLRLAGHPHVASCRGRSWAPFCSFPILQSYLRHIPVFPRKNLAPGALTADFHFPCRLGSHRRQVWWC